MPQMSPKFFEKAIKKRGGYVNIPSGNYTMAPGDEIKINAADLDHNLVVDMEGARIIYLGDKHPFHLWSSISHDVLPCVVWKGGMYDGSADAEGCFLLDDVSKARFDGCFVREFRRGIGFHGRNMKFCSENNNFTNLNFVRCKRDLQFSGPAALSRDGVLSTGRNSFARTKITNIFTGPCEYVVYVDEAGVYDSLIEMIGGTAGNMKAVLRLSGDMSGTVIRNIVVEQGKKENYVIDETRGFIGASGPMAVYDIHPRQFGDIYRP